MSDPESNEFLQQITKLIHLWCKEHYNSQDEESIEAVKMIFILMADILTGIAKSYPKDLAESYYVRMAPTKINETLELKRPTPRMIFDALRIIVVALHVGSRKISQEEYDESSFAKQMPSAVMGFNFRELADAAEILNKEALMGAIHLQLDYHS